MTSGQFMRKNTKARSSFIWRQWRKEDSCDRGEVDFEMCVRDPLNTNTKCDVTWSHKTRDSGAVNSIIVTVCKLCLECQVGSGEPITLEVVAVQGAEEDAVVSLDRVHINVVIAIAELQVETVIPFVFAVFVIHVVLGEAEEIDVVLSARCPVVEMTLSYVKTYGSAMSPR